MRRRLLLAAILAPAALGPAGVASAADAGVQAVDGTAANGFANSWAPRTVSVVAGDTVTWRFDGTVVAHNVANNSPNWDVQSPIAVAPDPVAYRFTTPGTYGFICQIHPEMTGSVLVAAPGQSPPPPPPPEGTGPAPFPNPTPAPEAFERSDDTRPQVTGLRVRGVRRGVRLRFRLSEDARVTIRFKRGDRIVRRTHVRLEAGTRRVTTRSRRLDRRRYQVQVRARDYAGNRSAWKRDRVRLR